MGVLVGAVVILFAFNLTVYGDVLPECDGIESKTFIADSNDCESYFYCEDEESFASKCPNNQRFSSELGICDDAENVECLSEAITSTTFKTSTSTPSTSEAASSTTILPSSLSSSESSRPSSVSPTKSSISTPFPSSSTTTIVVSSTTQLNNNIVCPTPSKPEEIIYLPNLQSCSEYYMCFNTIPIPMTCPKDLQFNTLTSACDWATLSNCKIIGSTTTSPRELCNGHTSGYFEYSSNCHYYYRCLNGMLTIQECPSGFGWDAEIKSCSSKACRGGIIS